MTSFPACVLFFPNKTRGGPQALATRAVIERDFKIPQFPGLVASRPQIALFPKVGESLASLKKTESDALSLGIFPCVQSTGDEANSWHLIRVTAGALCCSPQKTSEVLN